MFTPDNIRRFYEKRGIKIRSIVATPGGFVICCNNPQKASDLWGTTDERKLMVFYTPDPWYHRVWGWLRGLRR